MAGRSRSRSTSNANTNNNVSQEALDDSINNSLIELTDSATVFQCHNCLSILGDSSSFVEVQEDIGIIVLKLKSDDSSRSLRIPQKPLSKDVIPGLTGKSKKVFCAKCSQQVGAVYIESLSPPFTHLKDCLCLQVDNITSYNIPAPLEFPALNSSNLISTLTYTIQEIAKLKHVIMNVNERLVAIERSLEEEST